MSGVIKTEVIVVGAGLTGAALACGLARFGVDTVLIDRTDPVATVSPSFDGRASAIALASQKVLSGIGLWPRIDGTCEAIREIRVSDGPSLLFLHYDHRELGDQPLGYMAENRNLRAGLIDLMADCSSLTLLAPAEIKSARHGTDGAEVELADGKQIKGSLLVAAEGRNSQLRQDAGIAVTGWTYDQQAIVATIGHTRHHDGIAHEHFLPAGPFAILPLKDGHRSSLVWTEHKALTDGYMALADEDFLAEIAERVGGFLGDLSLIGPRFSHPLGLQVASRYMDGRLALVGDAAHGIHPIAGQGLNLGLRDAAALIDIVIGAKRLGLDAAHPAGLARYQRWRRADNLMMAGTTDILNRLFSNDVPPLKLARDMGLAAVNGLKPLKQLFMRHAMGTVGDLPNLMQGRAPG